MTIMVLAVAFAAAGCGSDSPIDSVWEVVEVDGVAVEPGRNTVDRPYLVIDGDSISGGLGCNNGGGTIRVDESTVVVSEFFSELAGCLPESTMFVEDAITAMIGARRIEFELTGSSMSWTADGHQLRFDAVSAPPTTPRPEPTRSHAWGPLDCGDDWVEEVRLDDDGTPPLDIAQRFDATVVEILNPMPLWWEGHDGDGELQVLVLGQDAPEGGYQVFRCVDD